MVARTKTFIKERDMFRNMLTRHGSHLPAVQANDFSRSLTVPSGESPAGPGIEGEALHKHNLLFEQISLAKETKRKYISLQISLRPSRQCPERSRTNSFKVFIVLARDYQVNVIQFTCELPFHESSVMQRADFKQATQCHSIHVGATVREGSVTLRAESKQATRLNSSDRAVILAANVSMTTSTRRVQLLL